MKHREGASLFFIPLSHKACTVVHVTPYHENDDPHAFVTVEFLDGSLCNVPVSIQDNYLTTSPPKPTPVTGNKVTAKPGMLQRAFGALMRDRKKE